MTSSITYERITPSILFTDWEVRIVKNCARGLESAEKNKHVLRQGGLDTL